MVLSALFTSLKLFAIARAGLIPSINFAGQPNVDNKVISVGSNTGYVDTSGNGPQFNQPGMNQHTTESPYVAPPPEGYRLKGKQLQTPGDIITQSGDYEYGNNIEVSLTAGTIKDDDSSYEEGAQEYANRQVAGCTEDEDLSYEEGSYDPRKLNANYGSSKTLDLDVVSDFSSESESDESDESEIPGVPRKIFSQTEVYDTNTPEEEETTRKTAWIAPESTYTGL